MEYTDNLPYPPAMTEFVTYRVGCNQVCDTSWIELRGRVILKVKCADGLFIVMLEQRPKERKS